MVGIQLIMIPFAFVFFKIGRASDDWYAGTIAHAGTNQDVTAYIMMMTAIFFYSVPDNYINFKKISIFACVACWIATNTFKTYPVFLIAFLLSLIIVNKKALFSPSKIFFFSTFISLLYMLLYGLASRSMRNLIKFFITGQLFTAGKFLGIYYLVTQGFKEPINILFGHGPGSVSSRVALFKDYYQKSLPFLDSQLSEIYFDLKSLITLGGSSADTPYSSFLAVFFELGLFGIILYLLYYGLLHHAIIKQKTKYSKKTLASSLLLVISFFVSLGIENNLDNPKTHTFFIVYVLFILSFYSLNPEKKRLT